MRLRNPFADASRELFRDAAGCFKCGESGHDALHHIRGRVSDSPFNAAPLHNQRCHIGQGDIHTEPVERRYLAKTSRYLASVGYEATEADRAFLRANARLYDAQELGYWLEGKGRPDIFDTI